MSKSRYDLLILTHNRIDAVRRCFESLRPTLEREYVDCWVLDNASDYETANYVQSIHGGNIHGILSRENLGVAGGRARLLQDATANRIVFLDSDTVIADEHWLDVLDAALEPENVGLVGPGGSFMREDWSGFVAGRPGEVDTVAGYCVMVKAELFKQGLAIDALFAKFWHEDADLAFSARAMGYDVLCVPCGVQHYPAHSGYGQESGLHDANFARLRQKWQGMGIVKAEGGY